MTNSRLLRRWSLITLASTLPLTGLNAQTQRGRQITKPNVVVIMMDDIGYGDLASYGATDIRTPNLDKLAKGGARFTDSYANAAVCTPTRAAFITGRYQQRAGLEWVLGVYSDTVKGLRVSPASLPIILKRSGYTTGFIGKWHLGYALSQRPNAHGFDEFYGFLGGLIDYYTHTTNRGRRDLYENNTEVTTPRYITDEFTDRAVSFIERHSAAPFFLEVAYNATHMPFQPPPDAQGKHRESPLGEFPGDPWAHSREDYVRMLERADEGVGKILATLVAHGLVEKTLVIFTNDNGGEWLSRNEPFTNGKGTLWEGGIRVPLLMYWPGRIPAGITSNQVAMTMDVTASIISATGSTSNADYPLDGIDLIPIIQGNSPVAERDVFWRLVRPGRTQRAVRSGKWKLLIDGPPALRDEGAAPVPTQVMLFDLSSDPGERRDVAPTNQVLVRQLRNKLRDWEEGVTGAVGKDIIAAAEQTSLSAALARYQALKMDSTRVWTFDEGQLNSVGYWLLKRKRIADALTVFELNVKEYPHAANTHDSLAEAYLVAGDTARAIAMYRRAVEIDPKFESAANALKRLAPSLR